MDGLSYDVNPAAQLDYALTHLTEVCTDLDHALAAAPRSSAQTEALRSVYQGLEELASMLEELAPFLTGTNPTTKEGN